MVKLKRFCLKKITVKKMKKTKQLANMVLNCNFVIHCAAEMSKL